MQQGEENGNLHPSVGDQQTFWGLILLFDSGNIREPFINSGIFFNVFSFFILLPSDYGNE